VERSWEDTGYCCVRICRGLRLTLPSAPTWNRVTINRVWRPGFSQPKFLGRLLNSVWAIAMWSIEQAFSNDRAEREAMGARGCLVRRPVLVATHC
jgi:hypothetical protein